MAIEQVGVADLRYPYRVLDLSAPSHSTLACITLSVEITHHAKGTHISRFIGILERTAQPAGPRP